jgi:tripeptidyl-peptidase I
MKVSVLTLLTGLAAYASAAPAPVPHVVHEKRSTQMQKWSRRDVKLSRDTVIPISIGLTQSNLDKGYEFLMDVSHPESDNFGKHWSMEKVASRNLIQASC